MKKVVLMFFLVFILLNVHAESTNYAVFPNIDSVVNNYVYKPADVVDGVFKGESVKIPLNGNLIKKINSLKTGMSTVNLDNIMEVRIYTYQLASRVQVVAHMVRENNRWRLHRVDVNNQVVDENINMRFPLTDESSDFLSLDKYFKSKFKSRIDMVLSRKALIYNILVVKSDKLYNAEFSFDYVPLNEKSNIHGWLMNDLSFIDTDIKSFEKIKGVKLEWAKSFNLALGLGSVRELSLNSGENVGRLYENQVPMELDGYDQNPIVKNITCDDKGETIRISMSGDNLPNDLQSVFLKKRNDLFSFNLPVSEGYKLKQGNCHHLMVRANNKELILSFNDAGGFDQESSARFFNVKTQFGSNNEVRYMDLIF